MNICSIRAVLCPLYCGRAVSQLTDHPWTTRPMQWVKREERTKPFHLEADAGRRHPWRRAPLLRHSDRPTGEMQPLGLAWGVPHTGFAWDPPGAFHTQASPRRPRLAGQRHPPHPSGPRGFNWRNHLWNSSSARPHRQKQFSYLAPGAPVYRDTLRPTTEPVFFPNC